MTTDLAAAARVLVERTARDQGLPEKVSDTAVLRRVAAILRARP